MNVNPLKWFSQRELEHVPHHFTKCHTFLETPEMTAWVLTKLSGRYATAMASKEMGTFLLTQQTVIFFEDPSEAMLYELRWSGSK
jgi:hypothetical protein